MHDKTYEKLFAFPRMVEDLLRGFVPDLPLDEVDFSTLEELSAEFLSDELLRRDCDAVWRLRLREQSLQVLLLLKFQSQEDPWMAVRIFTGTGLLNEKLVRDGALTAGGFLPPVLPVVLYNGEPRWRAAQEMRDLIAPAGPELDPYQPSQYHLVVDERHLAQDDLPSGNVMSLVVQLEQAGTVADFAYVLESAQALLHRPEDAGLLQVFVDWIGRLVLRLAPAGEGALRVATLEELKTTLQERVAEWPKK